MKSRLTAAAIGFLALTSSPSSGYSQAVCRIADTTSVRLLSEIARYSDAVSPQDLIVRDSLRLPAVPTSQVTLVTQEAVCKKANAAYQADRSGTGGSGFSGRVYVAKAGDTYAVLDPSFRYGSSLNWTVVIMDSRYRKLSVF